MSLINLRRNVFFFVFVLQTGVLFAQKVELGGLIGGSYYWGDIVNTFQPTNVGPAATFFVRYHLNPRVALRGNFAYARIKGADSISAGSTWQRNRNLAFYSDIFELSGVVEYNLVPDGNMNRKVKTRAIPYVFGGLGVFHFNPKATNPITGKVVELQPLKLNGVSYSRTSLCIPIGVGYRFYLNHRWQIGVELSMRYSLTSYLDDVAGSSVYPDVNDLPNDDARVLYYPTKYRLDAIKSTGSTFVGGGKGNERGKNEIVSDVYFIGGVTFSYRIWPGQAVRCPRIY
jgi:hypothetical protein